MSLKCRRNRLCFTAHFVKMNDILVFETTSQPFEHSQSEYSKSLTNFYVQFSKLDHWGRNRHCVDHWTILIRLRLNLVLYICLKRLVSDLWLLKSFWSLSSFLIKLKSQMNITNLSIFYAIIHLIKFRFFFSPK